MTDARPESQTVQPAPVSPNCPDHGDSMQWDADSESFRCTEPCGWRFYI